MKRREKAASAKPRGPLSPPRRYEPNQELDALGRSERASPLPKHDPKHDSSLPSVEGQARAPAISTVNAQAPSTPPASSSSPSSGTSFIALRKSRDPKKTFVSSASLTGSVAPPQRTPTATPSRPRSPSPPRNPSSTAAGAGLSLLRKLNSYVDPSQSFRFLSHYPPQVIPRILAPVLEPDTLGHVLLALRSGAEVEGQRPRVREILEGLKQMPRWRMNVAMLLPKEKEAGEEAWRMCDGNGKFKET